MSIGLTRSQMNSSYFADRELSDAYFETRFGFDPRRDLVWKEVCTYLQRRHMKEDSRIIDLGAGYCNFINNVRGAEKHALDIFSRMPEFAAADVITHTRTATAMDCFEDDSFDVAFASNLLEHLNREELFQVLYEVRRILKRGGKLILLQPNFKYCSKTYFDDYTHVQIFTDRGLFDLLEAFGFRVTDDHPRFLPVNMKSTLRLRLPFLPLIVRTYLRLPYRPFAGQMLMVGENWK